MLRKQWYDVGWMYANSFLEFHQSYISLKIEHHFILFKKVDRSKTRRLTWEMRTSKHPRWCFTSKDKSEEQKRLLVMGVPQRVLGEVLAVTLQAWEQGLPLFVQERLPRRSSATAHNIPQFVHAAGFHFHCFTRPIVFTTAFTFLWHWLTHILWFTPSLTLNCDILCCSIYNPACLWELLTP